MQEVKSQKLKVKIGPSPSTKNNPHIHQPQVIKKKAFAFVLHNYFSYLPLQ